MCQTGVIRITDSHFRFGNAADQREDFGIDNCGMFMLIEIKTLPPKAQPIHSRV